VERVVTESIVGEPLKGGRLNRTAECAGRPKTDIVSYNQQDVRSTLRRFDSFRKIRGRIFRSARDVAFEVWFWFWQDFLLSSRIYDTWYVSPIHSSLPV
jgi:hypothetical protein